MGTQHDRSVIMIVEDNEVDYETARRALKRIDAGLQALWCKSAEDAFETLSGMQSGTGDLPALVLVDINMPGMGGIAFLKKIKDAASPLRPMPVVTLSSSERQSDINACYDAGANGYLVKTPDLDRFYDRIKALHAYWFDTVKLPAAA